MSARVKFCEISSNDNRTGDKATLFAKFILFFKTEYVKMSIDLLRVRVCMIVQIIVLRHSKLKKHI